jgi:3-dehydroquinate dehydratase-1
MPEPETLMSILVIRGPERHDSLTSPPPPLPPSVLGALVQRAGCAGQTLAVRSCGSTTEVLTALRLANEWGVRATLLDPGSLSDHPLLQRAVQGLANPYVEVHDNLGEHEIALPAATGHRLAVVDGYGARSYALALEIALEQLGCAECECDVHVGT